MGTKEKRLFIPTDANMTVTISSYRDLEDGGNLSDEAYKIAQVDLPSKIDRDALEERIRSMLHEDIESDAPGDVTSIEFSIDWNARTLEVCEWCESPECDGDGDCDSAPEWCDGCEEYTGGECDCVYCEECEEYNCDRYHNHPLVAKPSDEQIKSAVDEINRILKVANDNSPDVESVL